MTRILAGAVLCGTALLAVIAFAPGAAHAEHVSCGDVITEDTTLDSDLDCGDLSGGAPPALTIGADGVTLDLNGHTISTACETDCAGTVVVDDSGGYDRVRIRDGTIRPGGVAVGVALVDVDKSVLEGLTVAGFPRQIGQPGVGISLSNSDRNEIDSSTIAGGDPALLLSASDRNEISRSSVDGGISFHAGDGVRLVDGSDRNKVVDSVASGDGNGIVIGGSVGNRVTRSRVGGLRGIVLDLGADRSVIFHNRLEAGRSLVALDIASDENVIRRNQAHAGLLISGDRNRLEHNEVDPEFLGIRVLRGDANRVRTNNVVTGGEDGIGVLSAATNTLVQGNLVTGAFDDGIDADAPGTIIRANTATNNGDLGIEAVPGVIDGGGNRASGNGNPLQCLNVVCR